MRWGSLAILLATIAFAEDAAPVQVLKDTGFDAGPSETASGGWFNQAAREEGVTSEWQKDGGRDGSTGIHIAAKEDTQVPLIWRQVVSDVPTLRRYRMKGWVKTKDVANDAIICIRCSDAKGGLVAFGTTQGTADAKGTADWKEIACEVVPPEGTKAIDVLCFLMGSGECWFDDVTLTAGEKADAAPVTMAPVEIGKDQPGIFHLRGMYDVQAAAKTAEPVVLFPLPLSWGPQVPLRWEVRANPSAMLRTWRVYERKPHDWVAEVHLRPLAAEDKLHLEWEADVLCGPSVFAPLPKDLPLEKLGDVPDDAKAWLAATRCVQCGDAKFAAIAKDLKGAAKDVADLVARIQAKLVEIQKGQKGQAQGLGALEALEHPGSCTSNANLAAAVYRACGLPTRILSGYPLWSGPLQTHYIVEVRFPGQGWFPVESTMLRTPWPQSQQVAVSLVYPEDEEKSAQRWTAADGVPYASLTEAPGSDDHFTMQGVIPGRPACDHDATRTHEFPCEDAAWSETLEAAGKHWAAWLAAGAKDPVAEETREACRCLGGCATLAELKAKLAEISR